MKTNIRSPKHRWIHSFTGKQLWPLSPKVGDVCIEDIAHALSNKCRFTGHTRQFYSVAQHSVLVSEAVPRQIALAGLLHDASEYMLPDVASPVKDQLKGFREIEEAVLDAVYKKFELFELRGNDEVHDLIKEADERVLAVEVRDLMTEAPESWNLRFEADPQTGITPWLPAMAEVNFLRRFRQLWAMRHEYAELFH